MVIGRWVTRVFTPAQGPNEGVEQRRLEVVAPAWSLTHLRWPSPAATPRPGSSTTREPRLSDREREVAELLLQGMPYRDIGSQLFISAKTVEHHVARIRRRLGAESRSELMSMLRAILGTPS